MKIVASVRRNASSGSVRGRKIPLFAAVPSVAPDGKKTATKALTRFGGLAYIATTHGAPPLGAMTRLCEAPH